MKKKRKKNSRTSKESPWAIVFIGAVVIAGFAAFIKEYKAVKDRIPAAEVKAADKSDGSVFEKRPKKPASDKIKKHAR